MKNWFNRAEPIPAFLTEPKTGELGETSIVAAIHATQRQQVLTEPDNRPLSERHAEMIQGYIGELRDAEKDLLAEAARNEENYQAVKADIEKELDETRRTLAGYTANLDILAPSRLGVPTPAALTVKPGAVLTAPAEVTGVLPDGSLTTK